MRFSKIAATGTRVPGKPRTADLTGNAFDRGALCPVRLAIYHFFFYSKRLGLGKYRGMTWIVWALLSAVFAAATALLAKLGVTGIDSELLPRCGRPWWWSSRG